MAASLKSSIKTSSYETTFKGVDEESMLQLNAFMAGKSSRPGPSRKRARVQISDTLNSADEGNETRPTPKKAPRAARRTIRELREIVGRYGKGPISYI